MGRAISRLGQCGGLFRFVNYSAGGSERRDSSHTFGEKTIFKTDTLRDLHAAHDSLRCAVFQYEDGMADIKGILKTGTADMKSMLKWETADMWSVLKSGMADMRSILI